MDHEGDNSSLYPQKDKLDGEVLGKKSVKKTSHPIGNSSATQQRRASLTSNGDSSRRDSMGKFSSPNNKEDAIPHYLRASTGSCHDLCKYGRRHAVEEKPWQSYSKRVAKTPSSKLRSKESANSVETKKVTEVKHIPRETKTEAEDLNPSPNKTTSQNFSEMMKNEVSLSPKEEVELSLDKLETAKDVPNLSPDKNISQNSFEIIKNEVSLPPLEMEQSPDILETVKDVLNPSPDKTISRSSSEIIENEVSLPPLEIELSLDKLETGKDVLNSAHGKTISQSSSEIIENEVSLPPKEVEQSPDKLETAKDVLETELKTSNVTVGHAPLLQPKSVLVKASPSSEMLEGNLRKGRMNRKIMDGKLPRVSNPLRSSGVSQGPLKSRKPGEMKDMRTLAESKASQKEVVRSSINLPSSTMSTNKIRNLAPRKNNNFKLVPLKDQTIIRRTVNTKQLKNEKVTVKTLKPLETDNVKTLAKPVRRGGGATSSRNRKEEEGEREGDEQKTGGMDDAATKLITTNKDASKGKRKEGVESKITRTPRKGTTMKHNDSSSPMKLNFRKGKVVQPHSDNSAPRRLKFRRGLTLMGNKDGISDAKKTYKKGVVDDKDVADPSSKKIVLRHQAVQNKKVDRVLLNNVIEETASKLVGTRKSKVKALVGAFETVISLHESKSPTKAAS